MQVLGSDKTGTLTLNRLTLDASEVQAFGGLSPADVLLHAAMSARWSNNDAIDKAVTASVEGGQQVGLAAMLLHDSLRDRLHAGLTVEATSV